MLAGVRRGFGRLRSTCSRSAGSVWRTRGGRSCPTSSRAASGHARTASCQPRLPTCLPRTSDTDQTRIPSGWCITQFTRFNPGGKKAQARRGCGRTSTGTGGHRAGGSPQEIGRFSRLSQIECNKSNHVLKMELNYHLLLSWISIR